MKWFICEAEISGLNWAHRDKDLNPAIRLGEVWHLWAVIVPRRRPTDTGAATMVGVDLQAVHWASRGRAAW